MKSFFKNIFYVILFLVLSVCLNSVKVFAANECVIGYGYATTVMSKENQEHFYLGFDYGLKEAFKFLKKGKGPCQSYENIKVVKVDIEDTASPLEAVKAASDLINKNVIMLAGFPTSHEALLAARVAQKNKMAFVSMGAVANGLSQYKDFVFTTSPKRQTYAKELARGLAKRHKGKEILVVAKKDFVFSMDILDSLKKENQKNGSPVMLTPVYLQKNMALDEAVMDQIDYSKVDGVYITLYSSISRLAFLDLARRLKPETPFYVSSSWVSHKVDFFDEVSDKIKERVVAFGAGVPMIKNPKLDALKQLYLEKFKEESATEVFEGYEGAVFVANVLYNAKAPTKEAILDSLNATKCVSVYTRNGMCRTPEGYSNKQLYFYHWKPTGYEPESI